MALGYRFTSQRKACTNATDPERSLVGIERRVDKQLDARGNRQVLRNLQTKKVRRCIGLARSDRMGRPGWRSLLGLPPDRQCQHRLGLFGRSLDLKIEQVGDQCKGCFCRMVVIVDVKPVVAILDCDRGMVGAAFT